MISTWSKLCVRFLHTDRLLTEVLKCPTAFRIDTRQYSSDDDHRKWIRKYLQKEFLDSLRIYVKAGAGGNGYAYYGGTGGRGGSVYLKAKSMQTLDRLRGKDRNPRFIARNGNNSRAVEIAGIKGKDLFVPVPVGIRVRTDSGEILGELNAAGDTLCVAEGGPGGKRANQFVGQEGQAGSVVLDLMLIADIGLLGFPNAGKSTLLKAASRAKPKIASYPFTTINPKLAVVPLEDGSSMTMADLPGLIEGAHKNVGMGHSFLRHVERTKLILYIVDVGGFQLSPMHNWRSSLETVILLNRELELYKPELVQKPTLLAVNKMDLPGAQEQCDKLIEALLDIENTLKEFPEDMRPNNIANFDDIIPISAKMNRQVVMHLMRHAKKMLDAHDDTRDVEVPSSLTPAPEVTSAINAPMIH